MVCGLALKLCLEAEWEKGWQRGGGNAAGTIKNEMPGHILWTENYFQQEFVVEITMRQATLHY